MKTTKISKSTGTEDRRAVVRGWGKGQWGVMTTGEGAPDWDEENVKINCGDGRTTL